MVSGRWMRRMKNEEQNSEEEKKTQMNNFTQLKHAVENYFKFSLLKLLIHNLH